MALTASFLVTVVGALVVPVAHLTQRDTVSVVTSELARRAGRRRRVAHVLQLVRVVAAVVVAVADEVVRHAAAVLTGELVLLARLVGAALLVAAVATVIAPIAPGDGTAESADVTDAPIPIFNHLTLRQVRHDPNSQQSILHWCKNVLKYYFFIC